MAYALVTLLACKGKEPAKASPSPTNLDPPAAANTQPGSGLITGSADGQSFTNAAALVIESPDVQSTTVIYVFSKPVRCMDLSFSEWDRHLPEGTTFLALKVFGQTPGLFPTAMTETPGPGEATATYFRSTAPETSNEIGATGGTVSLMALTPRSFATVSFSLAFGGRRMSGDVAAAFCPGGHEP